MDPKFKIGKRMVVSSTWKQSWESSREYWLASWKKWRGPMIFAAILFVLWTVANPSVVPFLLFRIQPFNDPIIGITFHHNLSALSKSLVELAISSMVVVALTAIISRRWSPASMGLGYIAAGLLTLVSLAFLAVAGVPIGHGNGNFGITMAVDFISLVFLLPVLFWWWPWRMTYNKLSFGDFMGWLTHSLVEKALIALAWLIGLAVSEMLAAGVAWATFSPLLGMVTLALLAIIDGALTWGAAIFYARKFSPQMGPSSNPLLTPPAQ